MNMPNQEENTVPSNQPAGQITLPPVFYAAIAIALVGAASFFGVFLYLDTSRAHARAQAASVQAYDPFEGIVIEGKAAVVIDLSTGETLYEKNADAQLPLASITKMALALVVAENTEPDTMITIPYSTMHLVQGDRWTVRDLTTFTLITSSNEGASMLASATDAAVRARYPLAPVQGATLWRMNAFAAKIGLQHTYFLNVHGLDESETLSGGYGSARDVAKLLAYAASTSPGIFSGTARDGLLLSGESGITTQAINTNDALGSIPGLIMGKTGFTDLAGGNLAVVFDVGLAHPVVAVVLGSSRDGRFTDMRTLVTTARTAVMQQ